MLSWSKSDDPQSNYSNNPTLRRICTDFLLQTARTLVPEIENHSSSNKFVVNGITLYNNNKKTLGCTLLTFT